MLGLPHPRVLLGQVTSSELTDLLAFQSLEDEAKAEDAHGWARLGLNAVGLLCATIGNFSPISKRHDLKFTDFVGGAPKQDPQEQMVANIKATFAGLKGTRRVNRSRR